MVPAPEAAVPKPRAADNRIPGRRGTATRQRLLDCTAELLSTTSYRDVKVIDIAKVAETSPATFYQYFADVEAAVLVLAEEMAQRGTRLVELIDEGPWRGRSGLRTATSLVDSFFDFWDEHRSVLRVVDLVAEEGDVRFRQIRTRLLHEVTNAMAGVVRAAQKNRRQPEDIDPVATAGVLVSMLAHVAAHRYGFEFWGIRTADLRQSMAHQLFWGVTGQKP